MNWIEEKTLGLFVKTNGMFSRIFYGGLGHIFMLHRVLPEKLRNNYNINRGLAITPEYLEEVIIYLKNKNYQFISLDELYQIVSKGEKPKQKFICFTLDDGYKDNLEYGFPIFQKYNIPFTLYVSNCFPNHTAVLWWYQLEEKIENNSVVTWNGKTLTCNNASEKQNVYQLVRNSIKAVNRSELDQLVKGFFNKEKEEVKKEVQKIALSWTEIKELSKEQLVTIGAHTLNHLSLKNLSAEDLEKEITDSKIELQENIGTEVAHFAYPYGGFDDAGIREYQAAKKAGFKTAVLNHPGNIFYEHKNAMMTLPRYPLGNTTTKQQLEYYLNGIQHFSANPFTKIIKY